MAIRLNRLVLVAMGSLALAGCGINSVPAAEENAKAKWADVQSAYQRRADLIPNLVATVEAGAESEQEILTEVIEARSRATSIQVSGDDLTNPEQVRNFEAAQNNLSSSLARLMVVVEQYPQVTSQRGFEDLRSALEGSENRIDTARTRYNEAVQQYNTTIRTFPDTIGANIIHGAEPMEPFSAQAGAEIAPTVEFGSSNTE